MRGERKGRMRGRERCDEDKGVGSVRGRAFGVGYWLEHE